MKIKSNVFTIIFLAILLTLITFSSSCKREGISEPSLFGPSSFYLTFNLEASPNVLYATNERPLAQVKATLWLGGNPSKDKPIYFSILAGPGEFSDYKRRTLVLTDENGTATVTYIGPTNLEIDYDQFVTIKAQPETESPYYIHKEIDIRILKGN